MNSEADPYLSKQLIRLLLSDHNHEAASDTSASLFGDLYAMAELSIKHGLGSLLYSRIKDDDIYKKLNPTLKNALKSQTLTTIASNEKLFAVIPVFHGLQQPFVFLKGMALLPMLYKEASLRPMSDIDIISKFDSFPLIVNRLKKDGFREMRIREGKIASEIASSIVEDWKTLRKGSVVIDLHSRISFKQKRRFIEGDYFIQHSMKLRYGKHILPCPEPELMLLHLLIHLDKHLKEGVARYSNLVDILLFLKEHKDSMDWGLFKTHCEKTDTFELAAGWLTLLKNEFELHSEIPDYHRIPEENIAFTYLEWMQRGSQRKHAMIPPWEREIYGALKTSGQKRKYIFSILFPSLAYMRSTYGIKSKLLVLLYYPVRIISRIAFYLRRKR